MSDAEDIKKNWIVCNEVDARLQVSLRGADAAHAGAARAWFELAPLERREWELGRGGGPLAEPVAPGAAPLDASDAALAQRALQEMARLRRLEALGWLRLVRREETAVGAPTDGVFQAIFVALFVLVGALNAAFPSLGGWAVAAIVGSICVALIVAYALFTQLGQSGALRLVAQMFALSLTLLVGIGLPCAAIYWFGGGRELLAAGLPSLEAYGRLAQGSFVAVAALFPALLYYLFDRFRLGTLRAEFERHVLRFDPQTQSLAAVRAKYGSRLDETYGREAGTASSRHGGGTRWPIQLGTAVVVAGWLAVLAPVGPPPALADAGQLLRYFQPQQALPAFGFLGAYFFAVFAISRRYTRGDLQPKTYSHVVARMLIVTIAAWVLDAVLPANGPWRDAALVLVFLIGVAPDTFYTVLGEFLRLKLLSRLFRSLEEKDPLTNIEGVDLYDRTRLAEEGVTNVQGLAHHDVIDLMLATRIPVPRLVDWLDQAILCLHVPEEALRVELRRHGIRTATGYLRIYREVLLPLGALAEGALQPPSAPGWPRLQMLEAALQHDEWLSSVQHWHQDRPAHRQVVLDA